MKTPTLKFLFRFFSIIILGATPFLSNGALVRPISPSLQLDSFSDLVLVGTFLKRGPSQEETPSEKIFLRPSFYASKNSEKNLKMTENFSLRIPATLDNPVKGKNNINRAAIGVFPVMEEGNTYLIFLRKYKDTYIPSFLGSSVFVWNKKNQRYESLLWPEAPSMSLSEIELTTILTQKNFIKKTITAHSKSEGKAEASSQKRSLATQEDSDVTLGEFPMSELTEEYYLESSAQKINWLQILLLCLGVVLMIITVRFISLYLTKEPKE